ncbi:hypothetical protein E2N93_09215 [Ruminococcus bromii]|uniref:DUF3801 domain-containing protein n=1 Tax=Ruminococcus bromii TaxID=40518 RepID=A0ABT0NJ85_9FIRM|nr:hypothetical protein [Ruminococcus bromii]MCL3788177.1 hypothetical protein [Ruminococcus bromii]
MNSVEDTAQTMFATQTVKGIVQQATSIIINKAIYGNYGKNHNVVTETAQQSVQQKSNNVNELSSNIKLTGQFTDIAYADTDKITEKAISVLCNGDEKLLNNVMDTYNNAVNDGLLKREWSKAESDVIYTLTDKGKELVNSEDFKKQLEKNIKNTLYNENFKNTAVVEFTGTKDDVNVFRYVDTLNIKSFDNNPVMKKMFDMLKKYEFISVDENGNAKPTDKLNTYFAQQDRKGIKTNLKITKVTPDNMQQAADKIQKAKQAAQATKKNAEVATKAAKTTVNAAAKTGAATATAGVSIAVDISKKGFELLKKSSNSFSTQNHINKS